MTMKLIPVMVVAALLTGCASVTNYEMRSAHYQNVMRDLQRASPR